MANATFRITLTPEGEQHFKTLAERISLEKEIKNTLLQNVKDMQLTGSDKDILTVFKNLKDFEPKFLTVRFVNFSEYYALAFLNQWLEGHEFWLDGFDTKPQKQTKKGIEHFDTKIRIKGGKIYELRIKATGEVEEKI